MMTEKRFNVFDVDGTIFLEDHKKGSYHIGEIGNVDVDCLNDIADKLNELSEQADAVREELRLCEEENTELQKENEQLKIRFREEKDTAMRLGSQGDTLMIQNHELKKENEQLKSEIDMLKTTIGRNEAHIQRMKYGGE